MTRTSRRGGVFALAAAALLAATGSAVAQDRTVAFSVSDAGHPFYSKMVRGVEDAGKERGYEVLILDAQKRSDKQLSDGEDALARGIDMLLINGVDKGAIRLAQMGKEAGIPVIMLQRDYGGDVADMFIGTDNVDVGHTQADWFAKQFADDDEFKIFFVYGIPGAASAEDRIVGTERALKDHPHVRVLAKQSGEYDRAKSLTVVENLLQRHPDVEGIVASNDEMAMGALAATMAQGKGDVAIIGIDGNADTIKAIGAGQVYATLAFSPYDIGGQGVEYATRLLEGEETPKKLVAEVTVITEENAADHIE